MSLDAADALERLLLEKPQQLGLQPRHHLADLVEEHRAAVGHLEQAALLLARIGERAALVTEQLAFEQRLGQRRAGDVHERPGRAIARVVQDLRGEILAGAALAGQQHRRRRACRDLLEQCFQLRDRRAVADDAVEAVRLRLARAQRAHFAAQAGRFERLLDQQRDFIEVERLVRVVIGARLHRLDRHVDARERRQQNHERVGVRFFDLLQDRQSVRIRQTVIEQHEVDAFAMLLERFGGGLRLDDAIAFLREAIAQRPADQLLVVDDENRGFGHIGSSLCEVESARQRSAPDSRARRDSPLRTAC